MKYNILTDLIQKDRTNNTGVVFIDSEKEEKYFTYDELYYNSLNVLYYLQSKGAKKGDYMILQLRNNEDFILSFWACILGGIIPVPLSVGNNNESKLLLLRIWNLLDCPHLITTDTNLQNLIEFFTKSDTGLKTEKFIDKVILYQKPTDKNKYGEIFYPDKSDVALIQFSSGSTGDPKGVVLTHENLMVCLDAISVSSQLTYDERTLCWMPMSHNMGVTGGHMLPCLFKTTHYIMDTALFLKNPSIWMQKISQHKVTMASSPNFGLKHFLSAFNPDDAKDWDLSSVKLIFNGSESISYELCEAFLNKLKKYGLKQNAIYPVYGMTEAGLSICLPPPGEKIKKVNLDRDHIRFNHKVKELSADDKHNAATFVDLGYPVKNCSVRVCDADNNVLDDGFIGQIQIKGRNVTSGYYKNEKETSEAFTSDGWFNTADLGFLRNGRLILTGRQKDMICVNGQNYYYQDIERVAAGSGALSLAEISACSVYDDKEGKEDILLFVPFDEPISKFVDVVYTLKNRISTQMGLEIKEVIPVRKISKTSSGKVQRYKLASEYRDGKYSAVIDEVHKAIQKQQMNHAITLPVSETEARLLKIFKDVLGHDYLGTEDNFFEFGGNSLKAGMLIFKIQQEFNVNINFSEFFNMPTVKKLAPKVDTAGNYTCSRIVKAEDKDFYKTSSAQKRLYIINQMNGKDTSYNLPQVLEIQGNLDIQRLENAFRELIARHESLRTSFDLVNGEPVQKIHDHVNFNIKYVDGTEAGLEEAIHNFIRPFDLSAAPLLRAEIIKLSPQKHIILFDIHHIICDGTSMNIIFNELSRLYRGEKLPEIPIQYKDFSEWQNNLLKTEAVKKQEEYWLNIFKDDIPILNMPTDFPRPAAQSMEGDSIKAEISAQTANSLNKLALNTGATLYMVLLAAFNILLSKYSGQEDLVVGSPIAGRHNADLNSTIGMFVNTIAMRNRPESQKTFHSFLNELRDNSIKAYENQEYQFDDLVDKLKIERSESRNPLFDVMFALQNMDMEISASKELKLTLFENCNKISRFDLTLYAKEKSDGIELEFEYCTRLFKKATIEAMAAHYLRILEQIKDNVEIKLKDIEILTADEKQTILHSFNATTEKYPVEKSVDRLFEEQVQRTPDKTALIMGENKLTYRQLNERANSVAWYLKERGVGEDQAVGIMVERSFEMIIGILGILKAGGAYLPIDPDYPEERINYLLANSKTKLLLANGTNGLSGAFDGTQVINISEILNDYKTHTENLNLPYNPERLIYVLYTSGSTGKPKGVMVKSHAFVNLLNWFTSEFNIGADDNILLIAPAGFDLAQKNLYATLIKGGKLTLFAPGLYDYDSMSETIDKERISLINCTPSAFYPLVDFNRESGFKRLKSLKFVILGGEAINIQKLADFLKSPCCCAELVNSYGPTECTDITSFYRVCKDDIDHIKNVPIGKPIYNVRTYVLDKNKMPLPIGVTGELYIGGTGLARGYYGDNELTEKKYVECPSINEKKVYRTGDLVRWLPDGNLEFLGRLDNQVKIRGFRIEIGEIESKLSEIDGIKEAAVVAVEKGGEKWLCAYIVKESGLQIEKIKEQLANLLPGYMVPPCFVCLEKLPLTPNGKLDKKALPVPEFHADREYDYKAPETPTEKQLAKIWQEVLGVTEVGINDNFFSLGGHSLNIIKIVEIIRRQFGVKLSFKEFYHNSTVEKQAKLIDAVKRPSESEYPASTADKKNMYVPFPLSDVQTAYLAGRSSWLEMGAISTHLYLEFETELDIKQLNISLNKVIRRHPMLRAVILQDGTQKILENTPEYNISTLEIQNLSKKEQNDVLLKERNRMSHYIFKPDTWPLFEFKALRLSDHSSRLLIGIDALIMDALSIKIVFSDILFYYNHPDGNLPQLEFTFRDYMIAYTEFKKSSVYSRDKRYWLNKLDGFPQAPALPLKKDPQDVVSPVFKRLSKIYSREKWEKIRETAQKNHVTPSVLLCEAYARVLAFWSNQPALAINATVFNRYPFHNDVQNIVGDFTSLVLLGFDFSGCNTLEKRLSHVQDTLMEALEHRHYDGVEFIRDISKHRGIFNKAVMPIVYTSMLLGENEAEWPSFGKMTESISQTPQVYIDNQVMESGGKLSVVWDYAEEIFDEKVILAMFEQYTEIIDGYAENKDIHLKISNNDRMFIENFNRTEKEYKLSSLFGLFKRSALKYPDNIAVSFENQSVTYRELDKMSQVIAAALTKKGIGRQDFVGVLACRRIETIANILGILKCGAAYVPIDPQYPEQRKNYILTESRCSLLLEPEFYSECNIDADMSGDSGEVNTLDDTAYVIYTSGSTGKPKGVVITHGAAANTILDINSRFNINETDKIIGISSMCFDLSVYDIFGALSTGAELVMVPENRDVQNLIATVEKKGITIWNSVPAVMDLSLDAAENSFVNSTLRLVMLSGDWIPLNLPEKVKNHFKSAEIISLGGATEGSVWSIFYPVSEIKSNLTSIPYGTPLSNQKIYVLNYKLDLCPVGVAGELYIGGKGVAKGYLNNPEKTKESFINHPELGYIYRTGDYGRLTSDGYIEFLGRKDSQIKIRGFRIELGEIENCLLEHDSISKAVVTDCQENGKKYLCAYIVCSSAIDSGELKAFLKKRLPDYMIPLYFISIDEIPLTGNGKVDRKKLPAPKHDDSLRTKKAKTENEIQEKLLTVWKKVFGQNEIGITDTFFELGGDSVTVIKLNNAINRELNISVSIQEIFSCETIKGLAELIKHKEQTAFSEIGKAEKRAYYPVSHAQKNLFAVNDISGENVAFNMPVVMSVKGKINIKGIEEALKSVINRQESLRTSFKVVGTEPVQVIHDSVDFAVGYKDSTQSDIDEEIDRFIQPFDLSSAPLIRMSILKLSEDNYIFMCDMPHIITDGASVRILINEIVQAYRGVRLPKLNMQYKDFIVWQYKNTKTQNVERQKKYWLNKLAGKLPVLNLPTDFKRPQLQSFEGQVFTVPIDDTLSKGINLLAAQTGTTVFMVLLSIYTILLYKYTGEEDIIIGTPVSGRGRSEFNGIIGMFANTLAMRNFPKGDITFDEFLASVKKNALEAYDNQDYPFDDLVDALQVPRDMSRNPVFDVMFTLQDIDFDYLNLNGVSIKPYEYESKMSRYDIILYVRQDHGRYSLKFEYCKKLFKRETIERMSQHFINILKSCIDNRNVKLSDISILSEAEINRLIFEFNETEAEYDE
jgi:amino acid adenylation domain-containing protein